MAAFRQSVCARLRPKSCRDATELAEGRPRQKSLTKLAYETRRGILKLDVCSANISEVRVQISTFMTSHSPAYIFGVEAALKRECLLDRVPYAARGPT